jgi:hypothetical protein
MFIFHSTNYNITSETTFDVNPLHHFEHETYEWKANNKKETFVHTAHYSAPVDTLTLSLLASGSHIHVKQGR